jgi:hypothetical protein
MGVAKDTRDSGLDRQVLFATRPRRPRLRYRNGEHVADDLRLFSGTFELVAEVTPQVAVVDRLQKVRHGAKVLLPQGGELVQELRRRVYELRKIALARGRGLPVVALPGKAAPAVAVVGVPFLPSGAYVVSGVVVTAV